MARSLDPQKRAPTSKTYMDGPVPSMRYKTPRPYSAEPVVTRRSNVPGSPTKGYNDDRPPVCTDNHGRRPASDFDERTKRIVRNADNTINTKGLPYKGRL